MMTSENKLLPALALVLACASAAHAQTDTRLPVISRMEVMYSLVTHYNHIGDRVSFYNQNGQPPGNTWYAVPHLVYEPIVTLYNPYNTDLSLPKSRVRLANPPVGFRFQKAGEYLRSEWNNGGPFLGLGRFQIANESNPNVEKTLTLLLTEKVNNQPGGSILLRPGESKKFMVWVEPSWTWGLETAGGFTSRAFLDFDTTRDLTNKDGRTNNMFGVETVAGQDYRAGFQTDSLSVGSCRPPATRYSFETGTYGTTGWVAMKLTDSFLIQAKGVDTVANPLVPDFELSLLAGTSVSPVTDTRKSYAFSIGDLSQYTPPNPASPAISRLVNVGNCLQMPSDATTGGKTPFASFVLVAKSAALQQRKFQAETQPPTNELYEARLEERVDFTIQPPPGPSDHPTSGIVVTGVERVGDSLMLDVAAAPLDGAIPSWKVRGGSDLEAGLTDDLSGISTIREGPEGSGVYKVTIPVPAGNERYFVQLAL